MNKIGTQTCYIHQCTKRYVDLYSMSVFFYAIPILHFKFPKFYLLVYFDFKRAIDGYGVAVI